MTSTTTQTADLFLLVDLEDPAATRTLAEGEAAALRLPD
jgi:hypothetical protein